MKNSAENNATDRRLKTANNRFALWQRQAVKFTLVDRIAARLWLDGVTEEAFAEFTSYERGGPLSCNVRNRLRDFARGTPIPKELEALARAL